MSYILVKFYKFNLVDHDENNNAIFNSGSFGKGMRAWGIVAHGRGTNSRPVYYLLKMTRVGSGLGTVCTHLCLMKP